MAATRCTLLVEGREPGPPFDCVPGKSLLDNALAAGWDIPYSCRRGTCESCRAVILDGATSPRAAGDGSALLCRTEALSDVRVEVRRADKRQLGAPRKVKAKVFRVQKVAPDVARLDLRFPAGVRVRFKAGQYLNVLLDGEPPRSYSMANAPAQSDGVQLHVRVLAGGRFSEGVLPRLKQGDELQLELPYGDFYLRPQLTSDVVLLAGGTGFAPIQAILQEAVSQHPATTFHLYWGARTAAGLYALEWIERLRASPNFHFSGVLSDAPEDTRWRHGLVHKAVLDDFISLADAQVYACGAAAMVSAARSDFTLHRGLPAGQFFSDAFVSS